MSVTFSGYTTACEREIVTLNTHLPWSSGKIFGLFCLCLDKGVNSSIIIENTR